MTADLVTNQLLDDLKTARPLLANSLRDALRYSNLGLTAREVAYRALRTKLEESGPSIDVQEYVALRLEELDLHVVSRGHGELASEIDWEIRCCLLARDLEAAYGEPSFDQQAIDNPLATFDATYSGHPSYVGQATRNRQNFAGFLTSARDSAHKCKMLLRVIAGRLDLNSDEIEVLNPLEGTLFELQDYELRLDACTQKIKESLQPTPTKQVDVDGPDLIASQTLWLLAEMERAENDGVAFCIPALRPVQRVDEYVEVFVPILFDEKQGELIGHTYIAFGAHAVPLAETVLTIVDLLNGDTQFIENKAFTATKAPRDDVLQVDQLSEQVADASAQFSGPSQFRLACYRYFGHLRQFADKEARGSVPAEFIGERFLRARESLKDIAASLSPSLDAGNGLLP